jgi:hypothetical protein
MANSTLHQKIRIVLTIAGKDITDAVRNKTTISVLFSALFLLIFYMLFPILEQEEVINLYDAGGSGYFLALEDSQPFRISVYDTQEAMLNRISHSGAQELGLVLPHNFDQEVVRGTPVSLQGYLLNWVSERQTATMVAMAETQIASVVGTPVDIFVERLFMLPESTGTSLNRGLGILLLVTMTGMILVPHLMLEEKRARTMDALLVSPATAGQIASAKFLAGLAFCLLGVILAYLLNSRLILQWGVAIVAILCVAFFSVSLGLFLGAMVEDRQNMIFMANLTIFPLIVAIFISIETEILPHWLVTICKWLPITAAFDLLRASFTPHTGFTFIAPRVADVLLFILIFLGLTAWRIKRSDRM